MLGKARIATVQTYRPIKGAITAPFLFGCGVLSSNKRIRLTAAQPER